MPSLYRYSADLLRRFQTLTQAIFQGFWLGILSRNSLYRIDAYYYDRQKVYFDDAYNLRGLWAWEEYALEKYFEPSSSLLVSSVGGGREILALRELGYTADGFECHPDLVEKANTLLQQNGLSPNIELVPRDSCPEGTTQYDGAIVGWGSYMLIQGRRKRVEFLKQLRTRIKPGGPILLSFFHRHETERIFPMISTIGNVFRFVLRRERLEPGDSLDPNYVHHFTESQLAGELAQAGLELMYYSTDEYGNAVCR